MSEDKRIEEILLKQYGPIMNLQDLSQLLDRSPDGLRMCIHSNSELGQQLRAAKKKIGRRIHFITTEIAKIISA